MQNLDEYPEYYAKSKLDLQKAIYYVHSIDMTFWKCPLPLRGIENRSMLARSYRNEKGLNTGDSLRDFSC